MKVLKNTSTQGLSILFSTPEGDKGIFLKPFASGQVPDSWCSPLLNNYVRQRVIKVINIKDEPVVVVEPKEPTTTTQGYVSPKRNNKHR